MPTVYFFCGLAAAGKSTLARKLEREQNAIRFTLDERMLSKFDLTIFDDAYGPLVREEKEIIWNEALVQLDQGHSVILDWSLWSRAARQEWTQRVLDAGYSYKLYFLDVPLPELKQRLAKRNEQGGPAVHIVPFEEVVRFSQFFEPPSAEEGISFTIPNTND